MQLLVNLFFLLQQAGVFGELVTEAGDMATDLGQHRLIARVLDCGLERLHLGQGLVGLLDLAFVLILFIAFAALVEAHAGLVHRLQHQLRDMADLAGLLDKLLAVLALGILEGIGAVVRQTGLEHIQVVGHAGHRPTGHFQRQVLGLGQLDELVERLAVGTQCLLDIGHDRYVGRRLRLEDLRLRQQPVDALVQGIDGLGVRMQRIFLLEQTHPQQLAVERRHLLEPIEAQADGLQGPDTDRRHQAGQQQYQGKPDTQFLGHTEIGETSLHGRNHGA